jgi:phosphodiesterase/alkaline phosphatase D-like protein
MLDDAAPTGSTPFDRRTLLRRGAVVTGGLVLGTTLGRAPVAWAQTRGVPAVRFDAPAVSHGVMAGDVTESSAVIWAGRL